MQPDKQTHSGAHGEIEATIEKYFKGLHLANADMLESVFSADCVLKAPGIRRTRHEWLEFVQNRPVPSTRGDKYAYKILSIDVSGEQAMVKVDVPLLDSNFIDYLGLLRENNQWHIVNKMYAVKPN